MERLAKGIHDLKAVVAPDPSLLLRRFREGNTESTLLVTCTELGIAPLAPTISDVEELSTIQNIGGMLSLEDRLGGDLAAISLLTKSGILTDIVVCGHYPCSALNLLVYPEEWLVGNFTSCSYIDAWVRSHDDFVARLTRSYKGARKGTLMDVSVREFVLLQLEKLAGVPELGALIRQRTLRLHGWMLANHALHVYDARQEEFIRCDVAELSQHTRRPNVSPKSGNARS